MVYLKWQCLECGDIIISNSKRHHQMDFCKCGKSGCDLEEDYMRWDGAFKKLKEYDYNFFDELLLGMKYQKLIEIGNKFRDGHFWITLNEVISIRKIEDEICQTLK